MSTLGYLRKIAAANAVEVKPRPYVQSIRANARKKQPFKSIVHYLDEKK